MTSPIPQVAALAGVVVRTTNTLDEFTPPVPRRGARRASSRFGGAGRALVLVLLGTALAGTILVVAAYPETAHLELEALNLEDDPIDLANV